MRNIENFLIGDNSLTQKAIIEKLEVNGQRVSQSKASKLIKEMGYRRKRLTKVPGRNTKKNLDERKAYAISISNIQEESLVFIDDTGFNLHTSLNYGYSPTNQRAFRISPSNRGRNMGVLAAITARGVVVFQIIDGSFNSEKFGIFLREHLAPALLRVENTLVMDNVRIQKTVEVLQIIASCGLNLQFLPSYSPQLNPIEQYFH